MADDSVNSPNAAYLAMEKKWRLPATLMGGTMAMRKAREHYLPQEPLESATAYDNRVQRSFLFNQFKKTIQAMTGKVFSREILLQDDVPRQIAEWSENADLAGRNLNDVAQDLFKDGAVNGLSYLLVDMQRSPAGATLAEERAANLRPYVKHIKARDLIGWRSALINGVPTLTQIRIREGQLEDKDEFGEVFVPRVRVIERVIGEGGQPQTQFRLFEQREGASEWTPADSGPMTIGEIPLAVFYGARLDFMLAEPPFEELAWLNSAHWQSASDQRHILHVARVPILFGTGLKEQGADPQAIGPNILFEADIGADLKFVEHSGQAIAAGRNDLIDTEERMRILAAQPLLPRTGNVTATATAIDTSQTNSQLQNMSLSMGDTVERALGFMADWAGIAEGGGSVKPNTDFGLSFAEGEDVKNLIELRLAGEISRLTLWQELKRRDLLMDDFDAEEEEERLEDEGTAVGMVGRGEPEPSGRGETT